PQCPVEGSAALLVVLRWQPPHRGSDHRIGESRLEARRDRVPNRLFEVHEQASIRDLARVGETPDAGVVVSEADDLGPVEPGEPYENAIEASERLIAVPGDGSPPTDAARIEARPAPLVAMPVPVADEHVHEPRGEERAGVNAVARVVFEMLEQALRPGQL